MSHTYGKCLCDQVEFELTGPLPKLYQCHCSQCRKATGAAANAALIVPSECFRWVRGQDGITSYVHDSGYRSDFCARCGSPVPNPLSGRAAYWVPAGLLEGDVRTAIGAHLHIGSKAAWDVIAAGGVQYQESPGLDGLLVVLRQSATARDAD